MGGYELVIIAVVAVLLFGGRLPTLAKAAGESIWEFKKGLIKGQSSLESLKEVQGEIKDELTRDVTV